jgi:hypothetical protein
MELPSGRIERDSVTALRFQVRMQRTLVLLCALGCSGLSPAVWACRPQTPGADEAEWLGESVDFGGDFDGDGRPDVLVGPLGNWGDRFPVRAYSGRSGEELLNWSEPPIERIFGRIGTLAALPDLDGDGVSEVAIATGGAPHSGEWVHIVSAKTGKLQRFFGCDSDAYRFGGSLLVLPGSKPGEACELLVSSWETYEKKFHAWSITSYSSDGWKPVWKRKGPSSHFAKIPWDPLLVKVGDLDRDGTVDLVAGFWVQDECSGCISALSGATGEELWSIPSFLGEAHSGTAIAPFDDLDSDGVADLLVSRGPCDSIAVWSGVDGHVLQKRDSRRDPSAIDCSISSVTRIADIDGDSFAEYAALRFGWPSWQVVMYSGKSGKKLYEVPCEGHFGCNTADVENRAIGSGDVNGDGAADFVVTVFTLSNVGDPEQGFHVLSGRDGSEIFRKTVATETAVGKKR